MLQPERLIQGGQNNPLKVSGSLTIKFTIYWYHFTGKTYQLPCVWLRTAIQCPEDPAQQSHPAGGGHFVSMWVQATGHRADGGVWSHRWVGLKCCFWSELKGYFLRAKQERAALGDRARNRSRGEDPGSASITIRRRSRYSSAGGVAPFCTCPGRWSWPTSWWWSWPMCWPTRDTSTKLLLRIRFGLFLYQRSKRRHALAFIRCKVSVTWFAAEVDAVATSQPPFCIAKWPMGKIQCFSTIRNIEHASTITKITLTSLYVCRQ